MAARFTGMISFHSQRRPGLRDPRLITDRAIGIGNEEIAAKVGPAQFFSATYRLFKLEGLEPLCDYGQAVIYKGGLPHAKDIFVLDKHHAIERGKVFPVCGNTWRMLKDTRFAPYFDFIGDFSTHFGIFRWLRYGIPFDAGSGRATVKSCC